MKAVFIALSEFPLNIYKNIQDTDLKVCSVIHAYESQLKFDFGVDRKSNMAVAALLLAASMLLFKYFNNNE